MADTFSIISMAITAAATFVLAIFTYRLFDEGRKQRELATRPDIGVFIDPGRLSHNLLYLVIQNIGRGAAYSVTFVIDPPDAGWTHADGQSYSLKDMAMLRDGLEYLPPGAERRLFYGPYNKLPDTPVRLTVAYHRKGEVKGPTAFSETFTLDRMQFEVVLQSAPYEQQVLRAVEGTAKSLKTIAEEMKRANR